MSGGRDLNGGCTSVTSNGNAAGNGNSVTTTVATTTTTNFTTPSSNSSTTASVTSPANGQRSRGRPAKKNVCTWCGEGKQPLQYVLPTQNGKKEFCSESCIAEFRKAYSKGACIQCDNVIRDSAPSKEFCSVFCLNKHQKKNGSKHSNYNNNNIKSEQERNNKLSPSGSCTPTGPFQYESFHVFDWVAYLQVILMFSFNCQFQLNLLLIGKWK